MRRAQTSQGHGAHVATVPGLDALAGGAGVSTGAGETGAAAAKVRGAAAGLSRQAEATDRLVRGFIAGVQAA